MESSTLIFWVSAKIPDHGKKIRLKALKLDLTCLSMNAHKMEKINHLDAKLSTCTGILGAKMERVWINSAAALLSRGEFLLRCSTLQVRLGQQPFAVCALRNPLILIMPFKRIWKYSIISWFLRGI